MGINIESRISFKSLKNNIKNILVHFLVFVIIIWKSSRTNINLIDISDKFFVNEVPVDII